MRHSLIELAGESLRDPRGAVRTLLNWRLPFRVLVESALLISVLGALIGVAGLGGVPRTPEPLTTTLMGVVFSFGLAVLLAFLIWGIGRMFGGTGRLQWAFAVVVWLDALSLAIQLAVGLAVLLVPGLLYAVIFVAGAFHMWLLTNFVAELHGFRSGWSVFLAILGLSFGLSLVLAQVLAMAGLLPNIEA